MGIVAKNQMLKETACRLEASKPTGLYNSFKYKTVAWVRSSGRVQEQAVLWKIIFYQAGRLKEEKVDESKQEAPFRAVLCCTRLRIVLDCVLFSFFFQILLLCATVATCFGVSEN